MAVFDLHNASFYVPQFVINSSQDSMPSMGSTEVKSIADDLVEAIESSAGSSKLLESLEDYSCSDKIRWNSVEGFKGETEWFSLTDRICSESHAMLHPF